MTSIDSILLAFLVVIAGALIGFEIGKILMPQNIYVKVPASLSDIISGTHLWKSASSNPPDSDRYVFTCVRLADVPQCIGVSRYKGGYWYDDNDKVTWPDYWMDVPCLPKEDKK